MFEKKSKIITFILLTAVLCLLFSPALRAEETLPTLAPINTPDPDTLVTNTPGPDDGEDTNNVEGFLWSSLLVYFAYACFFSAPVIIVVGITVIIVKRVKEKKRNKEEEPEDDSADESTDESVNDSKDGSDE